MRAAIEAPDGRTWMVRRRWVLRLGSETVWGRFRRRIRQTLRRLGKAVDAEPGWVDVVGEGIVTGILFIVATLLIIFVGLPLLIAVVDLAIVLVVAVVGLLARVVLRRPWTIEARVSDGTTLRWRVTGWRARGQRHSTSSGG